MEELTKLFSNQEFGQIRLIEIENKVYFVGNDVAKALGYSRPNDAITAHCKGTVKHRISDNQGVPHNYLVIPEGDIYRLVIKSQLPGADKFEAWIFDEVIPAIRKEGAYNTKQEIDFNDPDTVLKLAQNWADEKKKRIEAEAQLQLQKPKVEYVEKLMTSQTTFSTTEVAADLGMSARKLNKELLNKGIIRRLNTGDVLTAKYLNRGYEYMLPIQKDGQTKRQLRWTERGRAFLNWTLGNKQYTEQTQLKLN